MSQKAKEGWKLTAVEWEREVDEASAEPVPLSEEVRYGLRVSPDCSHLEENATERQALVIEPRRFRTRAGANWTPGSVFDRLPRLIQVGPRIFSSAEWSARTRHLFRMA